MSVRALVRIIIDFCEGDMKGAETLLDTGSLNDGFWWFWKKLEKKNPPKTRINERDMVVQGPGFGPGFDHGLGYFCPARGYCVGRSRNRCSCVYPSVRPSVCPCVRNEIGTGTTFWNNCEGMVNFGGPKTDPSRSWRENERVSMTFELSQINI